MLKFYWIILLIFLSSACHSRPEAREEVLRFAVISDLNKGYGSTTYLDDLKKSIQFITDTKGKSDEIELVLSTGDMVAGQKNGLDYQKMWNSFHQVVTTPLLKAQIAFVPSPGNHDASLSPAFAQERVEYQKAFLNQAQDAGLNKFLYLEGSRYPFYYAFIYKNALFVSLDATLTAPLYPEQFNWLDKTLTENNQVGLKVVFGHVPIYPFAFGRAHEYMGSGGIDFSTQLEKLLEDKKVDLFLSGHHHTYYTGHRKGHVEYISVPLLGDGPRKLLAENSEISPRGFLIFEWSNQKGLSMKALSSVNFSRIETKTLPEKITVPEISSESCVGCSTFSSQGFIPGTDRALYLRSDAF